MRLTAEVYRVNPGSHFWSLEVIINSGEGGCRNLDWNRPLEGIRDMSKKFDIDKTCRDNPDLPRKFVEDIVEAINEKSVWVIDGSLPPQGKVVIIEYQGEWRNRGNGGISDAYAWDGSWFNLPDTINVTRWMFIPE